MEDFLNVISLTSSEDESTGHETKKCASFTNEFKIKFDTIFSNHEYMSQTFPHLLFVELLNDIKQFMHNPKYKIAAKNSFWRNFLDKIYKPSLVSQYKIHKDIKYNRVLGAIMAEYLNFRCEILKLEIEKYPDTETARELNGQVKDLCQKLGASLLHIFNGNKDFVTFALLQVKPDKHYQILLSKLFSNILSYYNKVTMEDHITYVRLILCFRRWKTLVSHATVKKAINEISRRVLPLNMAGRGSSETRDFLQILPKHKKDKENATNFLINHKLLEGGLLDKAINRYFDAHEEYAINPKKPQKRSRFVKSSTLTEHNLNIFNNTAKTSSALAVRGGNSETIDLSSDDDVICLTTSLDSNNKHNINSNLSLSRLGSINSKDTGKIVPFSKHTSKCDNSIIFDADEPSCNGDRSPQKVFVENDADSESDRDLHIKINKLRRKKKKRKVFEKFRQNLSRYESTDSNSSIQGEDNGGNCVRVKLKSQSSRNSSQVSSTTNVDSIVPMNSESTPETCVTNVTSHSKVSRESTQSPHISTSNFNESPLSPVPLPSSSGIVEITDKTPKNTSSNPLYSDISDTEIDLNCSTPNPQDTSLNKEDRGGDGGDGERCDVGEDDNDAISAHCESTTVPSPDSGVSGLNTNNSKENSDNEIISVSQVSPPPSDGDFISKSSLEEETPCVSSPLPDSNSESVENTEITTPDKVKSKIKCFEGVCGTDETELQSHEIELQSHEIELQSQSDQSQDEEKLDEVQKKIQPVFINDDKLGSQMNSESQSEDERVSKSENSVQVFEEIQLSMIEYTHEETIEHTFVENNETVSNGIECDGQSEYESCTTNESIESIHDETVISVVATPLENIGSIEKIEAFTTNGSEAATSSSEQNKKSVTIASCIDNSDSSLKQQDYNVIFGTSNTNAEMLSLDADLKHSMENTYLEKPIDYSNKEHLEFSKSFTEPNEQRSMDTTPTAELEESPSQKRQGYFQKTKKIFQIIESNVTESSQSNKEDGLDDISVPERITKCLSTSNLRALSSERVQKEYIDCEKAPEMTELSPANENSHEKTEENSKNLEIIESKIIAKHDSNSDDSNLPNHIIKCLSTFNLREVSNKNEEYENREKIAEINQSSPATQSSQEKPEENVIKSEMMETNQCSTTKHDRNSDDPHLPDRIITCLSMSNLREVSNQNIQEEFENREKVAEISQSLPTNQNSQENSEENVIKSEMIEPKQCATTKQDRNSNDPHLPDRIIKCLSTFNLREVSNQNIQEEFENRENVVEISPSSRANQNSQEKYEENVIKSEMIESKQCATTKHDRNSNDPHLPDRIIKCLSISGQQFQRQEIVIETDKSNHVEFNKSSSVEPIITPETIKSNILQELSNLSYTYCQPDSSSVPRKPLTLVLDKKFENISDDELINSISSSTTTNSPKDSEIMQILSLSRLDTGKLKKNFMSYLNLTPNFVSVVEEKPLLIISPTPSISKGRRTKPKCVRKLDTTKPLNALINLQLLATTAEVLSDKPEISETPKLSRKKQSELKRSIKTKLNDSKRFRDRANRVPTRSYTRNSKTVDSKLISPQITPKSILKSPNVAPPVKCYNIHEGIWQQDRTNEIIKTSLNLIKIDFSKSVASQTVPSSTTVSSDSDSDRLVIADCKVQFNKKVKTITTNGEFITDLNDIKDASNNESDAEFITTANRRKKLTKTRDGNKCHDSESDEDSSAIKSHYKPSKISSNSDDISNWVFEIDLLERFETNFPSNDAFNKYKLPLIVEDISINATLNTSSLLTLFKIRFLAIHRCIKSFDIKQVVSPHTLKGVLEKIELIESKTYAQDDLPVFEGHLKDLDHHLRKLKKLERRNEKLIMLYDFLKCWDKRIKLRRKWVKTKWNEVDKVKQWHRLVKNGTEMKINVLNLGNNVLKQKFDQPVSDFVQLEQRYKSPQKIFEDTVKNYVIPDLETIGSTYGDSIATANSTVKNKFKSKLENHQSKIQFKTKASTIPVLPREKVSAPEKINSETRGAQDIQEIYDNTVNPNTSSQCLTNEQSINLVNTVTHIGNSSHLTKESARNIIYDSTAAAHDDTINLSTNQVKEEAHLEDRIHHKSFDKMDQNDQKPDKFVVEIGESFDKADLMNLSTQVEGELKDVNGKVVDKMDVTDHKTHLVEINGELINKESVHNHIEKSVDKTLVFEEITQTDYTIERPIEDLMKQIDECIGENAESFEPSELDCLTKTDGSTETFFDGNDNLVEKINESLTEVDKSLYQITDGVKKPLKLIDKLEQTEGATGKNKILVDQIGGSCHEIIACVDTITNPLTIIDKSFHKSVDKVSAVETGKNIQQIVDNIAKIEYVGNKIIESFACDLLVKKDRNKLGEHVTNINQKAPTLLQPTKSDGKTDNFKNITDESGKKINKSIKKIDESVGFLHINPDVKIIDKAEIKDNQNIEKPHKPYNLIDFNKISEAPATQPCDNFNQSNIAIELDGQVGTECEIKPDKCVAQHQIQQMIVSELIAEIDYVGDTIIDSLVKNSEHLVQNDHDKFDVDIISIEQTDKPVDEIAEFGCTTGKLNDVTGEPIETITELTGSSLRIVPEIKMIDGDSNSIITSETPIIQTCVNLDLSNKTIEHVDPDPDKYKGQIDELSLVKNNHEKLDQPVQQTTESGCITDKLNDVTDEPIETINELTGSCLRIVPEIKIIDSDRNSIITSETSIIQTCVNLDLSNKTIEHVDPDPDKYKGQIDESALIATVNQLISSDIITCNENSEHTTYVECVLKVKSVVEINDDKMKEVEEEDTYVNKSDDKLEEIIPETIIHGLVKAPQIIEPIKQMAKIIEDVPEKTKTSFYKINSSRKSDKLEKNETVIENVNNSIIQVENEVSNENEHKQGKINAVTLYHSPSESSVDYVEEFTKIETRSKNIKPTTPSKSSEEEDELIQREDKRIKVVQEIQSELVKIISNTSEELRLRSENEDDTLKRRASVSPDYKGKIAKIEITSPCKVPDFTTEFITNENAYSDNSCHSNKSGIDFPEYLVTNSASSQPSFSIPLITSSASVAEETEPTSIEPKSEGSDKVDIVELLISKNLSSNSQTDDELDLDGLRDFFCLYDEFDNHNVLDRSNTTLNWENEFPNSFTHRLPDLLDDESSSDKNANLKKEKDCMISGYDVTMTPWENIIYPLSYSMDPAQETCVNMDCILENKNKMSPIVVSSELKVENIVPNTIEPSNYTMVDIFANKSFDEVIYNEDQSKSTLVDQTIKELSNQLPTELVSAKPASVTVEETVVAATSSQNDFDLVVYDPQGDTESNVESPNPSYPKNYQQTELVTINHDDIKENDSKSENFELINVFLNRRKISKEPEDPIEILSDSPDSSRSPQSFTSQKLTSPMGEDGLSANEEKIVLPELVSSLKQRVPQLEQETSPDSEDSYSSIVGVESSIYGEKFRQQEKSSIPNEKSVPEYKIPSKIDDDKLDENVIILKNKLSPVPKLLSPEKTKVGTNELPIRHKSTPIPVSKHISSKLKRTPSFADVIRPMTPANTQNMQPSSKPDLKLDSLKSATIPNNSGQPKLSSNKNGPLNMPTLDFDEDSNCITQFIIQKTQPSQTQLQPSQTQPQQSSIEPKPSLIQPQSPPIQPPLPPPLVRIRPPPPPDSLQSASSKTHSVKVRPVIETRAEMNSFLNAAVTRELKRPTEDAVNQTVSKKAKVDKFDLVKSMAVDKLSLPHSSSSNESKSYSTSHQSISSLSERRPSDNLSHVNTLNNSSSSRSLSPGTGAKSCSNLSRRYHISYSSSSREYRSSSVSSQSSSNFSKPCPYTTKPVLTKYVPISTPPEPTLRTYRSKSRLPEAKTTTSTPTFNIISKGGHEHSYSSSSSTSISVVSSSVSKSRLPSSEKFQHSRLPSSQHYRSTPKNKYAVDLYSKLVEIKSNKNTNDVLVIPSWDPKQCSTDELLADLKKAASHRKSNSSQLFN